MISNFVSVIIPTYNRGHLIERSVKSILDQSFSTLEVIVVDDCSTDNTADVVKNIKDERVRYICLKVNSGANAARNAGVLHAKHNFIAFQDSDDVWHKRKLEIQMDFLIGNKLDVVASRYNQLINNEFNALVPADKVDSNNLKLIELAKNVISTQTILGKKECFLSEPFDANFPRLQDWELAIRLVHKYNVGYINDPLVDVYLQSDSISTNPEKFIQALDMLISKHRFLYNERELEFQYINLSAYKAALNLHGKPNKYLFAAYQNKKTLKILLFIILDLTGLIKPLAFLKRNFLR